MMAFLITAAVWASQAIIYPQSFASFLGSVNAQFGLATGSHDMGRGIFALIAHLTSNDVLALAGHAVAWALVAAIWQFALRPALTKKVHQKELAQFLTIGAFILCLIATPRLKIYDLALFYLLVIEAVIVLGLFLQKRTPWHMPLILLATTTVGTRISLTLTNASDWVIDAFYAALPLWMLLVFGLAAAGIARQTSNIHKGSAA